jgi:hypothetical protein
MEASRSDWVEIEDPPPVMETEPVVEPREHPGKGSAIRRKLRSFFT